MYFWLIILAVFGLIQCKTIPNVSSSSSSLAIGTVVPIGSFLVLVHRIITNQPNQTCLGTILSDRYILTAADCLRIPEKKFGILEQLFVTIGPLFDVPLTGKVILHVVHSADVALFRLDIPITMNLTTEDNGSIWQPEEVDDGSNRKPDVNNCFVFGFDSTINGTFTTVPLKIFSDTDWPYNHRRFDRAHGPLVPSNSRWIGPNGPVDIRYKVDNDRLVSFFEYCSKDPRQPTADNVTVVLFGGPLICPVKSASWSSSWPPKYRLFGVTLFSGPLSKIEVNDGGDEQQNHLFFFKLSHCSKWIEASMKYNDNNNNDDNNDNNNNLINSI